jgi:hypothetical protein
MKGLPGLKIYFLLPLYFAAVFAVAAAPGERIYKWTDVDGNTVYSQTPPPPGIKAERIQGAPRPPEDPDKVMQELRERAEDFSERRDDRLTLEKDGQEALDRKKQVEEICAQLRKNLETLQNNSRIREQREGEEPVVLAEEQRQERIKTTQERIQKECTSK